MSSLIDKLKMFLGRSSKEDPNEINKMKVEAKLDTICPLHQVELLPDEVSIFIGHPSFHHEYVNAKVSQFPKSKLEVYSPSVMHLGKKANVMYCPECRLAEKEWLESGGQKYDE